MFPRFPVEAKHRGKNIPLYLEKWLLPPARKFKGNVNRIRVMFDSPKSLLVSRVFTLAVKKTQRLLTAARVRQHLRVKTLLCQMLIFTYNYCLKVVFLCTQRSAAAQSTKRDLESSSTMYQYCKNFLKHETEISTIKQPPRLKTIPPVVVLQPAATCKVQLNWKSWSLFKLF